jgi:hypothetical protein
MAKDCRHFKAQYKSLSQINFMWYLVNLFVSGHLPLKKLTNGLYKKNKYLLCLMGKENIFDLFVKPFSWI